MTARLEVRAGGEPAPDQLAALTAAVAAALDAARGPGPDPLPPAYRSRWRRAGVEAAVAPWSRR